MEKKNLSNGIRNKIAELANLDKELNGLYEQATQHENALKEISKIRKEYKSDRKKTMYGIVGGNLMREMSNDEVQKVMQDRYKQTEIALESIKDQIKHREDSIVENYIRMYRIFKKMIPADILKELEEDMAEDAKEVEECKSAEQTSTKGSSE